MPKLDKQIISYVKNNSEVIFKDESNLRDCCLTQLYRGVHSYNYFLDCVFVNETKRFVVKIYSNPSVSKEDVFREISLLKSISKQFEYNEYYGVPKVIDYYDPEYPFVMTEYISAHSLVDLINKSKYARFIKSDGNINEVLYMSGKWLRYFQQYTKDNPGSYRISGLRPVINSLIGSCVERGIPTEMFKNINSYTAKLFSGDSVDEEYSNVNVHGDFAPWNVLFDGKKLFVLDLYKSRYGCMYDDLTLFMVVLEDMKGNFMESEKRVSGLMDNFLNGYGKSGIRADLYDIYYIKNLLTLLKWRLDSRSNSYLSNLKNNKRINILKNQIEAYKGFIQLRYE